MSSEVKEVNARVPRNKIRICVFPGVFILINIRVTGGVEILENIVQQPSQYVGCGFQVSQINKRLIRRETEIKQKSIKSINISICLTEIVVGGGPLAQHSVNLPTPPLPLLRSISGQLISFPQRRERERERATCCCDHTWGGAGREGRRPVSQPASVCY